MSERDPHLSALYRQSASEEPAAALDAKILAAAHRRVRPAAQRRRSRWSSWASWMRPAGVLATLVLTVLVTVQVEREHPEIVDGRIVQPASPFPTAAPPAASSAPAAERAPAAAASEKKSQADRLDVAHEPPSRAAAGSLSAQPVPPAALPVPARQEAPAALSMPASPAAPAEEAKAVSAPLMDAVSAERRAKAAAPRMMESNVADQGALSGASANMPAAAPAMKAAPLLKEAARPPEAWLAEIRRLKREGRQREAAEQLARFRRAFPDFAVPEDLADINAH